MERASIFKGGRCQVLIVNLLLFQGMVSVSKAAVRNKVVFNVAEGLLEVTLL